MQKMYNDLARPSVDLSEIRYIEASPSSHDLWQHTSGYSGPNNHWIAQLQVLHGVSEPSVSLIALILLY